MKITTRMEANCIDLVNKAQYVEVTRSCAVLLSFERSLRVRTQWILM